MEQVSSFTLSFFLSVTCVRLNAVAATSSPNLRILEYRAAVDLFEVQRMM
jgi:hypothetical protein